MARVDRREAVLTYLYAAPDHGASWNMLYRATATPHEFAGVLMDVLIDLLGEGDIEASQTRGDKSWYKLTAQTWLRMTSAKQS